MLKIYHNPRCIKSREGLAYLKKKGVKPEIINYLKAGLTREDIEEILLKTNVSVEALVKTKEDYFKRELKDKKFNRDEWIKIIIENPRLLQRPIVLSATKGVHANPPEKADPLM